MNIEILYEDDDILAINKPSGLIVHSDGKTKEDTLTDWILENYPQVQGVGENTKLSDGSFINRPGIVHRLDRETSGVMLIAKTKEGFEFLKQQFQEHTIEKKYFCIVGGFVKEDSGKIEREISRSKSDFRKWTAQRGGRGNSREALTYYTVIERFEKEEQKFSKVLAMPKTGRTHQIRVHFKAINHPLVSDSLYGKKENILGVKRLALHSHKIKFQNLNKEEVEIVCEIPEGFEI